jgi:hypothetical protein
MLESSIQHCAAWLSRKFESYILDSTHLLSFVQQFTHSHSFIYSFILIRWSIYSSSFVHQVTHRHSFIHSLSSCHPFTHSFMDFPVYLHLNQHSVEPTFSVDISLNHYHQVQSRSLISSYSEKVFPTFFWNRPNYPVSLLEMFVVFVSLFMRIPV